MHNSLSYNSSVVTCSSLAKTSNVGAGRSIDRVCIWLHISRGSDWAHLVGVPGREANGARDSELGSVSKIGAVACKMINPAFMAEFSRTMLLSSASRA